MKKRTPIKQTNGDTVMMLSGLKTKIGMNPNFTLMSYLQSKNFNSANYKSLLIRMGIVKSVGFDGRGQKWEWTGGDPNAKMAEEFLKQFRTKGNGYKDVSAEKLHREEIKSVNEKTGGLNFDNEPEKTQIGIDNEKSVLERWNHLPKSATNFPIQQAVYDHLAGNENEVGKKVVSEIGKQLRPDTLPQTKEKPPKVVEKTKLVYKYQLKIADGNLAFQFAFLWGLIKINFVYRGKGAQ